MSDKDFKIIFSSNLRKYLSKNEMSQARLAELLGVGTTSVYNWASGTKIPRMDKVDSMCEIFNCKRSDLIEDNSGTVTPTSGYTHEFINDLFKDLRGCVLFSKTVYESLNSISLDDIPVTKQELSLFLDMMDCSINLIRKQRELSQSLSVKTYKMKKSFPVTKE